MLSCKTVQIRGFSTFHLQYDRFNQLCVKTTVYRGCMVVVILIHQAAFLTPALGCLLRVKIIIIIIIISSSINIMYSMIISVHSM